MGAEAERVDPGILAMYQWHADRTQRNLAYLNRHGYNGSIASIPGIPETADNHADFARQNIYVPAEWRRFRDQANPQHSLTISIVGMPGAGKTSCLEELADTIGDQYTFPEQKPNADYVTRYGSAILDLIDDLDPDDFNLRALHEKIAEMEQTNPGFFNPSAPAENPFLTAESMKALGEMELMELGLKVRSGLIYRAPILADRGGSIDDGVMRAAYLLTHTHFRSHNLQGVDASMAPMFDAHYRFPAEAKALLQNNSLNAVIMFMTSPQVSLERRKVQHWSSPLFRLHVYYQYLSVYAEMRRRIQKQKLPIAVALIDAEQNQETVFDQFLKAVMTIRAGANFPLPQIRI